METSKTMEILIINTDALSAWNADHGTELDHADLTDEQFREACENYDGWILDSLEELVAEMNSDGQYAPTPSCHYIRVVKEKDDGAQIPAWVGKADLAASGFDTADVDDDMLERIADHISDDLHEQLYTESLIQAADREGLPRKADVDAARKKWDACSRDATWDAYDKVDDHTRECNITLEADGYLFEGYGFIVGDSDKEIRTLECTLPDGKTVTLINETK